MHHAVVADLDRRQIPHSKGAVVEPADRILFDVSIPLGNAAEAFLAWLEARGAGKAPTFIAHNASGYDSYLILQEIKRRRIAMPEKLIMAGAKLMYMKYKGVRFIDSMRHVAGSLEGPCWPAGQISCPAPDLNDMPLDGGWRSGDGGRRRGGGRRLGRFGGKSSRSGPCRCALGGE